MLMQCELSERSEDNGAHSDLSSDEREFYQKLNACIKSPLFVDANKEDDVTPAIPVAPVPPPLVSFMEPPPAASHQRAPVEDRGADFELRASMLMEQKRRLQPTDQPHPSQLCDVSDLPASQVDDLALALRQASALHL